PPAPPVSIVLFVAEQAGYRHILAAIPSPAGMNHRAMEKSPWMGSEPMLHGTPDVRRDQANSQARAPRRAASGLRRAAPAAPEQRRRTPGKSATLRVDVVSPRPGASLASRADRRSALRMRRGVCARRRRTRLVRCRDGRDAGMAAVRRSP